MSEAPERTPDARALPPGGEAGRLVQGSFHEWVTRPEPVRVYPVASEKEGHFWDYWRVLVRHRWTVITFFLFTVIVVMGWTFRIRPVFTASTTLRIEKEEPRVLKFEEVVKADSEPDYYQTQHAILRSRALAGRVISRLALDQQPEFQQLDGANAWLKEYRVTLEDILRRVADVFHVQVQDLQIEPAPAPHGVDAALESH